jgi:hypothetical protein
MKRTTRPTYVVYAIFGSLLCAAVTAGEVRDPLPTAPTLFYACMSTAGATEYDSAAFARQNPGPVYKNHHDLSVNMTAAFDGYLTQKYGFHGLVQCSQHNTLAEAQKWLQWRESVVRGLTRPDAKYVATDWTYDAAPGVAASTAATTQVATAHAGQPAASVTEPKSFYICIAMWQGVAYESAIFESANNAAAARGMMFKYAAYLSEKHKVSGMPRCMPKPTRAEAEAYRQQFAAGVAGGISQHVATGWVYEAAPTAQPATPSAPVASPVSTSTPVAPKPTAPKPVTPPTATSAAVTTAAATPVPAKKTWFVVCKADREPHARYYNPPVDGADGGYETWQPAYASFLKQKYNYDRGVSCNKQPTLAEAQQYFDTTLEHANLSKEINGIPSPVIVTSWKFK